MGNDTENLFNNYNFHRHPIKDMELLDPKKDSLEIQVEEIKQAINERIDEMARVRDGLPIPPHLCYFVNKEDIDLGLDLGPRPAPRPEQTVIIISEHPEYREYFKAVFDYEGACAALKSAHRKFLKDRDRPRKKRKTAQK